MRIQRRDGARWSRVAPIARNVEIGVVLAMGSGCLAVVVTVGVFTDWVPAFDDFTNPVHILLLLGMLVFSCRFALMGCYVSEVGLRGRWPYHSWTLRWEDIDDLVITKPGLLRGIRDEEVLQGIYVVTRHGRNRWTPLWSRVKTRRTNERDAFVLSQYGFFVAFQELREMMVNQPSRPG
jgi:hypothetical protein